MLKNWNSYANSGYYDYLYIHIYVVLSSTRVVRKKNISAYKLLGGLLGSFSSIFLFQKIESVRVSIFT